MTTPALTHQHALPHPRAVSEETVNQFTHGLGLFLAIIGATWLNFSAAQTGDIWRIWAAAIYSTTLVALYAASTLSHSFLFRPRPRHFFRMIDQVCIFLLIAGTYTPFGLVYLRDGWTWGLTIAIWSLALFGSVFRVFFSYLRSLHSTAYVLLGWLPVTAVGSVLERVPHAALLWLLVGGLVYTIGTLFLARDQKYPYFHGVWHLLVVTASACHFWAIANYIIC